MYVHMFATVSAAAARSMQNLQILLASFAPLRELRVVPLPLVYAWPRARVRAARVRAVRA